MGNSLEDWKRVPTTADAVFGIHLPYRPPKNPIGAFFWRRRVWLETTFGLCLFEPWEKILILTIFYLLLTLVFTGLYKFVPQQLPLLYKRLLYYFFGNEETDVTAMSVRHLVAGLVKLNASASAPAGVTVGPALSEL
ncbi:hypothetical protein C8Q70DRAFT_924588 [Cubamyces menziesii]|uniref:Uncharacterized protein n=1 Tax=Trametes cubensis TaxID=1111947 RepID=A0AAD7TGK5_9APHY|nr:hypothetical protein C8Q70DRAFT_924588 [Cubamyces menziesii]KAJ8453752.1 hypothetical protein ONZ51_g13422 [Trametes cubensis]